MGAPQGRGAKGQTGIVVNAECDPPVGVPEKEEMTAVTAPFLPQPPHDLAVSWRSEQLPPDLQKSIVHERPQFHFRWNVQRSRAS